MSNLFNEKFVRKHVLDGVNTEFWKLILKAVDREITHLDEMHLKQMRDYAELSAEQCKIEIVIYNTKREYFEKMKEMPSMMIAKFTSPQQIEEDLDVYEKPEDFLPKKEE